MDEVGSKLMDQRVLRYYPLLKQEDLDILKLHAVAHYPCKVSFSHPIFHPMENTIVKVTGEGFMVITPIPQPITLKGEGDVDRTYEQTKGKEVVPGQESPTTPDVG
jgi:hypothetical protein